MSWDMARALLQDQELQCIGTRVGCRSGALGRTAHRVAPMRQGVLTYACWLAARQRVRRAVEPFLLRLEEPMKVLGNSTDASRVLEVMVHAHPERSRHP